jgi:hypothetical protein
LNFHWRTILPQADEPHIPGSKFAHSARGSSSNINMEGFE